MRYALVTGGGGVLGEAFCLQLAREGWWVAVADVDRTAGERVLRRIQDAGGQGQLEVLDVADADSWGRLKDKLRAEWPQLDLLVNNAGVCASAEIGDGTLDVVRKVFEINLLGVIYGCHTMLPWMKESASGAHVVNVASIATVLSAPAMGAYSASKAGVLSYSETLYAELYGSPIGATVVVPGFFPSGLLEKGTFSRAEHRRMAEAIGNTCDFSVADVVDRTLRAVRKKQFYVVLGRRARWVWRLKRLVPTPVLRVVAQQYRSRLRKSAELD